MKAPQASVSIPPKKLAHYKRQAKEQGISLSRFLHNRIMKDEAK